MIILREMKKNPKIAIIHDAFLYRGGGERLVSLMAKSLDADLIAWFFSEWSFDPRELGFTGKMIALGKPVFMKWVRHMMLKWRFYWNARVLRKYDIVIFSGDCLWALRHVKKKAKKVYYCHTPPRYLYDLKDHYLSKLPPIARPIFAFAFSFFSKIYKKNLAKFDAIYTNSKNVEKRLKDYTWFDSEIIYPPTDTTRFIPAKKIEETNSYEYFLSFARLSPPKRVDIIIDAFLEMPEKHLVFCYGKNDPMKDEILEKIAGRPNFHPYESPDDAKLISLIQWATATIYIPIDEDFGMSPVESMACGTPVIGSKEWGILETVIDGATGKLIEISSHEAWVIRLKDAILETPKEAWESMKKKSLRQSEKFSLEKFRERLQSLL